MKKWSDRLRDWQYKLTDTIVISKLRHMEMQGTNPQISGTEIAFGVSFIIKEQSRELESGADESTWNGRVRRHRLSM